MRISELSVVFALVIFSVFAIEARSQENLLEDPSFELTKPADQFGLVFEKWGGWKYEGQCKFAVGTLAHSGKTSALLVGSSAPKIRLRAPERELPAGRYRVTAFIRGLDVTTGTWNRTTEFMMDEQYFDLKKNGAFGWTPLTYVFELPEAKKITGPSFGLWAPGYFWIDDVSLEKVSADVALTPEPVLGAEEAPIAPAAAVDPATAVRCPACAYRNAPSATTCYACGAALDGIAGRSERLTPRVLASFEKEQPEFSGGEVSLLHATDGSKSMKLVKGYAPLDTNDDWSGYDYLKADAYNAASEPATLYVEIRDDKTTGYWTRVNYLTVVPPGESTVIIPTAIYVGEKSRPGRMLDKSRITRLVFGIEGPPTELYIDNVRLEADYSADDARFDGLYAFDLGLDQSPLMEGFTRFTPSTVYTPGRGYGLVNADVWRGYDALQPEPLYEDFICIQSGGVAVDLPNGKYHVFMNIDSPSGFWGEYQTYDTRTVTAEGKVVVKDTMDFDSFIAKYFRYWNVEDLPTDDTFDKYQENYFDEKEFDVEVADGQLNIDFSGSGWACSVSCIIIHPAEKAAEGERFLDFTLSHRRFHFDNYFKRILHTPAEIAFTPSADDAARGFALFAKDVMEDVYYNDKPSGAPLEKLSASAFAGEYEPVAFSVYPLADLGTLSASVSDLCSPAGAIPADSVKVSYVMNRLSRVTMEGSVYTIRPRNLMPESSVAAPAGITRRFWLSIEAPASAAPGLYTGAVTVASAAGGSATIPLELTVRKGALDPLDVPAGPWGHSIDLPFGGPASSAWQDSVAAKCLTLLHDYGFTSFSGMPIVRYNGFRDGKPVFDFTTADAQMARARAAGFTMPVINYCTFSGLNLYFQDSAAMTAAGFADYSQFIRVVFSSLQQHADEAGWLPVYWNLGDEPIGDDLTRSTENAAAYRKAFPDGPPYFTAATSFSGSDGDDPHFKLAKELHVANFNGHDEPGLNMLHAAGADWAFYNGGNRWTYGTYMYKAVKEFDMKFRLSWHFNVVAGDPYYALDCREDDYAWCNASPDGRFIESIPFQRLRAGIDDYRYMLTLSRLASAKPSSPEAAPARKLISDRLASFKLTERNHDALFDVSDWSDYREKLADAIESLQ